MHIHCQGFQQIKYTIITLDFPLISLIIMSFFQFEGSDMISESCSVLIIILIQCWFVIHHFIHNKSILCKYMHIVWGSTESPLHANLRFILQAQFSLSLRLPILTTKRLYLRLLNPWDSVCNTSINIMPHYLPPPPGQCRGRGGDAKVECITYWVSHSVKSQSSPPKR